jgi:hypothetical protein
LVVLFLDPSIQFLLSLDGSVQLNRDKVSETRPFKRFSLELPAASEGSAG